MTGPRQRLGQQGEALARRHLESNGYSILEANFRTRSGEIDLVAEAGGTLVFVEVRTRRASGFGTPEESIDTNKKAKLARVAEEYIQAHGIGDRDWRIDLVAVELGGRGRAPRVEIIENAVEL